MTFALAVMAGIGFASVNIADVTLARSARVTPAVTAAQTALSDAMTARDRECKGGIGKFCREREAEVAARRQVLDGASAKVGETADPQTEAAMRAVLWLSDGMLKPTRDHFGMLRLILLALLPQIGGCPSHVKLTAPGLHISPGRGDHGPCPPSPAAAIWRSL
jgi:hypothetical protein